LNPTELKELKEMALDYGILLDASQLNLLDLYLEELLEWNKKINLTGLSSKRKMITDLLIDSLIPSKDLPNRGSMLDVGSGAGFPAIPLLICKPDMEAAILLEPIAKRAAFLRQVVRLTRLRRVEVLTSRIENSAESLQSEGYQIITSRALAQLPQVLKWCAPHLAANGVIITFQGSNFAEVLKNSSDIIKTEGLILKQTIPYTLPDKTSQRTIVIFGKDDGLAKTRHHT
jgi:16S rRNA (guanine527-N7)-methyltransferase